MGIDRAGVWHLLDKAKFLKNYKLSDCIALSSTAAKLLLVQSSPGSADLVSAANGQKIATVDLAFPVLHGPYGEDGTIQGLFKLTGIPFVGCGVLGSALNMDKGIEKRLLKEAGIPVAKFRVFDQTENSKIKFADLKALGLPLFVKPANLGSSVGISRVETENEFNAAIKLAFSYDTRIVVEEGIAGQEIEVAVMGNQNPEASIPGEIVPASKHGFYSYDAKYIDDDGAALLVPAKLSPELVPKVQSVAIAAYKTLCCEGLSRVDMFVKTDGTILVNEINTLPGFTSISMYPKLWEASGVKLGALLDKLIGFALDRFQKEAVLSTAR